MTFNKETSAAANDKQKSQYKNYSSEMFRRQAMRQTHGSGGFKWLKEHDPERLKQIIADREAKRAKNQQTPES